MTKTQLLKSAKIISFPVLVCNDPLLKLFPLLREGGTLYFFSSLSFPRLLALSVLVCDIVSSWERESQRWRCWDMALKVNEVCRFLFLFSCLCVILELAWADLACILWLCGLCDIDNIYFLVSRSQGVLNPYKLLKESVVQEYRNWFGMNERASLVCIWVCFRVCI